MQGGGWQSLGAPWGPARAETLSSLLGLWSSVGPCESQGVSGCPRGFVPCTLPRVHLSRGNTHMVSQLLPSPHPFPALLVHRVPLAPPNSGISIRPGLCLAPSTPAAQLGPAAAEGRPAGPPDQAGPRGQHVASRVPAVSAPVPCAARHRLSRWSWK